MGYYDTNREYMKGDPKSEGGNLIDPRDTQEYHRMPIVDQIRARKVYNLRKRYENVEPDYFSKGDSSRQKERINRRIRKLAGPDSPESLAVRHVGSREVPENFKSLEERETWEKIDKDSPLSPKNLQRTQEYLEEREATTRMKWDRGTKGWRRVDIKARGGMVDSYDRGGSIKKASAGSSIKTYSSGGYVEGK